MDLFLGIELGSTRIKSVLIDETAAVLAQGSFEWENRLTDGLWSYALEDAVTGLQESYAALAADYRKRCGADLCHLSAIGISGMMHGYLAFDKDGRLLVPFRTWRNTNAAQAAKELTDLFGFNIPMRWSVAHYAQAVLNAEPHVKDVSFLTTLAGYIHYRLTGRRVIGIGEASGMFPVRRDGYDPDMLEKFDRWLAGKGLPAPFERLLPAVLRAGEPAGVLSDEGARLLDPSGKLQAGCPLCPPEGDAGTGMVATNSVRPGTANVSAGTSAFLMAVLDKDLEHLYPEIDMVTTPAGDPVAMVHVNNFTSEINAWTRLFEEVLGLGNSALNGGALFDALFRESRKADPDCGGLMGYNFLSGEPIAGIEAGTPMVTRAPDGRLTLANFMRMQIYSALGSLAMGCRILEREHVRIDRVYGHGGFFKTPFVGQSAMSAAIGAPVTVLANAGEGGAWGIALLARFALPGETRDLSAFLDELFRSAEHMTVSADAEERKSFDLFLEKYTDGLTVESLASRTWETRPE